jgi:hypothetical protein
MGHRLDVVGRDLADLLGVARMARELRGQRGDLGVVEREPCERAT